MSIFKVPFYPLAVEIPYSSNPQKKYTVIYTSSGSYLNSIKAISENPFINEQIIHAMKQKAEQPIPVPPLLEMWND
jgi:hypothetical protein